MSQTHTIGRHATTIGRDDSGRVVVTYHTTPVVTVDGHNVTLRSGGWRTATTKSRMNQTANQLGLRFNVYQKDWDWFVSTPDGVIPFTDGMTFHA